MDFYRGRPFLERIRKTWQTAQLVHFPVHASRLNQMEIYFSIVQRKVPTPTKEKIGGNNLGGGDGYGSCDPKEKTEYTIRWAGNTVVGVEPQGKYLPLLP